MFSISKFDYEHKTPYRIYNSKQIFEKHVNLLLSSNSTNSDYVLIRDFDIFLTNKTKHHGKKTFFLIFLLIQKIFRVRIKYYKVICKN